MHLGAAGPFGGSPGHMQFSLAHSGPEVVAGHLSEFSFVRMDAVAQDLWGIGLLFLFTLMQHMVCASLYNGHCCSVQALHNAWVRLCT